MDVFPDKLHGDNLFSEIPILVMGLWKISSFHHPPCLKLYHLQFATLMGCTDERDIILMWTQCNLDLLFLPVAMEDIVLFLIDLQLLFSGLSDVWVLCGKHVHCASQWHCYCYAQNKKLVLVHCTPRDILPYGQNYNQFTDGTVEHVKALHAAFSENLYNFL